ncbi:MAG: hypothetical protein GY729_00005 [Desulfobacteraceae bacterium]|nr:hypothetical protein [Desulfobacteraceae bacterium]
MKKFVIGFLGLALVAFLTACNVPYKTSNPGDVLGAAPGGENNQRIVTFSVVGKGLEPETAMTKGEAILMAERAAIADGYRQFVEKLRGVYVDAFMKAGYGTVDMDVIKTKTQSWLRGVEIFEVKSASHGIVEAHMQLRINFTQKGMVWWPSGIGENVVTPAEETTFRAHSLPSP